MDIDQACKVILKHGYDLHLQQDGQGFTAWTKMMQDAPTMDEPSQAIFALASALEVKENP